MLSQPPLPPQLPPDLPGPVHAEVRVPDASDLRLQPVITDDASWQPCRIGLARLVLVVRRWGVRQHRADRLDPVRIPVRIDERGHYFGRRSSSAWAKYADALRRISVARRSWRISRSCSLSRAARPSSALAVGLYHARPGVPSDAASQTCIRSSRRPTEWRPIASRAGARDRTPTGRLAPGPLVNISSVFPWTPSSQEMEPPGNPGRFRQMPLWDPDGRGLYFQESLSQIMFSPVEVEPTFSPGTPRAFPLDGADLAWRGAGGRRHYDIDPAGDRFLVRRGLESWAENVNM